MSVWLDEFYLKQIASRLTGFVAKDKHLFNCRCHICGDSKKSKTKKRGYFFPHDKKPFLVYSCKNCGVTYSFFSFLKQFDYALWLQYKVDKFKELKGGGVEQEEPAKPSLDDVVEEQPVKETPKKKNIFTVLTAIKDLPEDHEAFVYAKSRLLPLHEREMYFAEHFIEWTKRHTDKFEDWRGKDHPRIIFPFRSREGKVIGYTARSLHGEEPKYYRIFTDESEDDRFYGIDLLDESKQVYVLEGEIDSMFLPNAIAVSNGNLTSYHNKNAIYIPDADRRNPQILKMIEKMILAGYKTCLMPDNLQGKDINEFVKNGLSQKQILDIIHANTYQGLQAKLKFASWKIASVQRKRETK